MWIICTACKKRLCGILSLSSFFLAMNHLSKFKSKNFLNLVKLGTLKLCILINLLHRNKRKKFHTLDYVIIADISPILIELIRWGFFSIKPNSALFGLTHFLTLWVGKKSNCHSICITLKLPSDKLHTANHIWPLVITAELKVTAVFLIKSIEVIALHNHIVKFKERKTSFHSLLITFKA